MSWLKKRMVIRHYDRVAHLYDRQYREEQNLKIKSALRHLHLKESDIILDAGCGTGRITYRLVEAGCNVVGVDFSKESLKVCRQRCSALNLSLIHI